MSQPLRYYTYLISSLPMLHFGARPPFSFAKFFDICVGLMPEADIGVIRSALEAEPAVPSQGEGQPTLSKWRDFDRALRNELVKIRAVRRKTDPAKYFRGDGYAGPSFARAAMNAQKDQSIDGAEKSLDAERWRALDELSAGHYFDIDFLIIYALKLAILEKWGKFAAADKRKMLEGIFGDNLNAA